MHIDNVSYRNLGPMAAMITLAAALTSGVAALEPINQGPSVLVEPAVDSAGPVNAQAAEAPAPVGAVNAAPAAKLPTGSVVNAESAAPAEEAPALAAPASQPLNSNNNNALYGSDLNPAVKMTRSGLCLPRGDFYYDKEQIYVPLEDMAACLSRGGREIDR